MQASFEGQISLVDKETPDRHHYRNGSFVGQNTCVIGEFA
jgi:hypothetical protein